MLEDNVKLRIAFKLSQQQVSLLLLLLSMKVVHPQVIYERLSVATEVRVAVHRLRHVLEPFGITIENKRSLGYWLSDESKARIREILAEDEK